MRVAYPQIFALGLALIAGHDVSRPIRGVNMGGWLVLEPWINPSMFDQFLKSENPAVDEYTFCEVLGKNEAAAQLKKHWDSWVTRKDFEKLSKAGITHIRFPIGYWAIDAKDNEPWVQGQLDYLKKGVKWAKEFNMEAVLDIHGAPGSQNGFDNSGRFGKIGFFDQEDNISRMINVISNLTKEFSAKEFKDTVTAIQVANEPAGWELNNVRLKKFYSEGYNNIRNINRDIQVMFHDAFVGPKNWTDLPKTMNKIILDTHIYQVFDEYLVKMSQKEHLELPCTRWDELKDSKALMPTVVGEFSLATTDCTRWLNGFKKGSRYQGDLKTNNNPNPSLTPSKDEDGKCYKNNNIKLFDSEYRTLLKNFANQQFRVYETAGSGWYFWNFKAENSPEWSFLQGVEEGWIDLKNIPKSTCSKDK